jgi:outer membrane lipopolysaccharide assembly protein LptE/RlpB
VSLQNSSPLLWQLPHGIKIFFVIGILILSGCGYHFEGATETEGRAVTISVPYIKGDPDGMLGMELVRALTSSGQFDCVQTGGMLILEAAIIAEGDDRIGFRFDRNPTTGSLRDNIVGTENRLTVSAEVKLIDAYTNEVLIGPQIVKAYADYDYVDSNSIRDLTFFTPNGTPEKVLDFSLGQLDSVEGAHDDSFAVIYRHLAQKIIDGIIVKSGSDSVKKTQDQSHASE